jgi:hypothetical protein
MFGKYMSTIAMDAEHDAERRRAEALRELMARPDAEPDPVRIEIRRPAGGSGLRHSIARWLAPLRRRPSKVATNR